MEIQEAGNCVTPSLTMKKAGQAPCSQLPLSTRYCWVFRAADWPRLWGEDGHLNTDGAVGVKPGWLVNWLAGGHDIGGAWVLLQTFSPCTSLGAPRKDWESPEKVSSLVETGRRESCHCSKGRKCLRLPFLSYRTVLVCERHSRSVTHRALVKSQWMWGMGKESYLSPWCRNVAGWLRRVSPEAAQRKLQTKKLQTETRRLSVETSKQTNNTPIPLRNFRAMLIH